MNEKGPTPVPKEARAYQGRRAGLVTRLVAGVVDGAVIGALLGAGYAGWAGFLFILDPRHFSFPELQFVFSFFSAFAVSVVYLTVSWWMSGRTYGDLLMGLRVVGPGGRPLGLAGSALRALFCVVLPVGLLWVAPSPENRSLQDLVLRSSVVYDWQPQEPGSRPDDEEQ